jgi:hypothetical protein
VIREDRSVRDLLSADYTFVNERLARHGQWRRVAYSAGQLFKFSVQLEY